VRELNALYQALRPDLQPAFKREALDGLDAMLHAARERVAILDGGDAARHANIVDTLETAFLSGFNAGLAYGVETNARRDARRRPFNGLEFSEEALAQPHPSPPQPPEAQAPPGSQSSTETTAP
jgi:hypothetical protein